MKPERIFHKGTFIGTLIVHDGLVYAYQAHALPGHPAHYSGKSKKDARQWLAFMRDCPVYVHPMNFICDPGPRLAA